MVPHKIQSVLILDDDPIQRELLASHLRRRGVPQILTAADGREAKRQIAAHGATFDVILSDLNMPDFDGIEFLMFLDEQKLRAALVFISGASKPVVDAADKLATIHQVNYRGHLRKPLAFDALDRLLDDIASTI